MYFSEITESYLVYKFICIRDINLTEVNCVPNVDDKLEGLFYSDRRNFNKTNSNSLNEYLPRNELKQGNILNWIITNCNNINVQLAVEHLTKVDEAHPLVSRMSEYKNIEQGEIEYLN